MAVIELDAIRVVNLASRTDRREETKAEIAKAVEAGIFPDIEPQFSNKLPSKNALWPASFAGHSGYYQTGCEHQRIMEDLFREQKDLSLILEDDAMFTEAFFMGFEEFWQDVQKAAPDWVSLFIGGSDINGRTPIKGSSKVALNNGSRRCHAYIVNRAGLWRLYDHLFCNRRVIDWSYCDLMAADKCCYSPSSQWFVTTRPSWSDNRQCNARLHE